MQENGPVTEDDAAGNAKVHMQANCSDSTTKESNTEEVMKH